jgi:hypothetical protein
MAPSEGPLATIGDTDLQHMLLALQLACGRAHGVVAHRRQGWFCFLFRVLRVEADLRGLPPASPHAHLGDLPPQAL